MLNTARNTVSSKERVRLENYLRTRAPVTTNSAPSIPRRGAGKNVPLTAVQQQIWVHAQMAPDLPLYNEPVTIHYSAYSIAKVQKTSDSVVILLDLFSRALYR